MTKKTYEIHETRTATEVGEEQVSFTLSSGFDKSPFDRSDETRDSVDLFGRVRRAPDDVGAPKAAG